MNKKLKIFCYCSCIVAVLVIVAFSIFVISVFSHLKPHYLYHDVSVSVTAKGTHWETDDGVLSFQNGVVDRIRQHLTSSGKTVKVNIGHGATGTLTAGDEKIPVSVELSDEGPYLHIFLDDGFEPALITGTETVVQLEKWEAIDATETETQVIITFKAIETTYFEVGQEFNLVHNKTS